ncbi:MAG: hypothetical protein JRN68_03290 [Nitrososphaerota archaeon]|nr:hypothetical protein [Nitrososphaerota archaeon]
MPMQGIMFRPKYKRGARYAEHFDCRGCGKHLMDMNPKDWFIYDYDTERRESDEKGMIMFRRCDACGTINWTHQSRSSINLALDKGATTVTSIPEWAEGDPSKGEMDWTRKGVDSRTMLPYGFLEEDMKIIQEGLQALWNNTETRDLVDQHLLKTITEDYWLSIAVYNQAVAALTALLRIKQERPSRLDYLLDERWFFVHKGEVEIFDRKDNY